MSQEAVSKPPWHGNLGQRQGECGRGQREFALRLLALGAAGRQVGLEPHLLVTVQCLDGREGGPPRVHRKGGLLERPGQFPSEVGLDLPLNEQARRYLRTGPSWLERTVPFRLAGILDRSILVLLPVVTLMFPLFGLVLPLLDRRHRRRIARRYERLRDSCLRGASSSPDAVKAEIEYLRALRREVLEDTDVPPMYFGEVFHLTMHIDQVLEQQERRLTHPRETLLSDLSSEGDSR